MSYTDGITGESRESSFSNSVAHYFDENGYLCNDIFDAEVLKLQNSLSAEKKIKWTWLVLYFIFLWSLEASFACACTDQYCFNSKRSAAESY